MSLFAIVLLAVYLFPNNVQIRSNIHQTPSSLLPLLSCMMAHFNCSISAFERLVPPLYLVLWCVRQSGEFDPGSPGLLGIYSYTPVKMSEEVGVFSASQLQTIVHIYSTAITRLSALCYKRTHQRTQLSISLWTDSILQGLQRLLLADKRHAQFHILCPAREIDSCTHTQ